MNGYITDLFLVTSAAVMAPLIVGRVAGLRVPAIVVEMLLGMLIGPHVLGWVVPDGLVGVLGEVGLAFLIFLVALEINVRGTARSVWMTAAKGWFASFLIALVITLILHAGGLIRLPPVIAAAALTTTALGVLGPILKANHELDTPLGELLLALGAMGEIAPMLLLSLMVIPASGSWWSFLYLVLFVFSAWFIWKAVRRMTKLADVQQMIQDLEVHGEYFPLRLSLLLLGFLVLIADQFGINIVIGAGAAGLILGPLMRAQPFKGLRNQLDAMGYGFLLPVFFVTSGMRFDPMVFATGPLAVFQVVLLLFLLLLVRFLPLFYFRHTLPERHWMALALYSATGLPVIVIITELALKYDLMMPERATVLVTSGMISVLVFPVLAEQSKLWFPISHRGKELS